MNLPEEQDWFNELSEKQQQDVLEALQQLDNGQTITHEEAKRRFNVVKDL